ncbi:AraC-like DNA-binding protein [Alteromonas sp. 76-1]|uniref:helix-turn-helix domain-containing protein n=1 Tax=Alteromonas sp. 76-1 TaxID=2358187 RepID=UPI000FD17C34|nr:helix-turn-helix domain-containing protein [Alteromonas sp. 76-1]VEL95805.1 AraC-like DNA-binding protein [Alteromonas sp. 76-1]
MAWHNELPYYLLVCCSLSTMLTHALKQDKQSLNYLVAIFSASLCMVATQKLSADALGVYQYVIGLATCATCNVVWLISRTLFREHNPLSRRHIAVALVVAGLVIFNQTWHLVVSSDIPHLLNQAQMLKLKQGMNEITTLLSSSILALSFWEALRGFESKSNIQKRQSIVFATAFFLGLFNSSILPKFLFTPTEIEYYAPWLICSSAILILGAIQYVVHSQQESRQLHGQVKCQRQNEPRNQVNADTPSQSLNGGMSDSSCLTSNYSEGDAIQQDEAIDMAIVKGINRLIHQEQIFLQPNLKIAHLAQALNTSEYKVSKAIRGYFATANFNLFVNQFRVKHAKQLLRNNECQQWSILVIALESGFSSLATFNRVFKAISGQMPTEYRKQGNTLNYSVPNA